MAVPAGNDMDNHTPASTDSLRKAEAETRAEATAPVNARPHPHSGASRLPINTTGERLRDLTDKAMKAILAANKPPRVFRRGDLLTRVLTDDRGAPYLDAMDQAAVRGTLDRVADWERTNSKDETYACRPPADVVQDLMALGDWSGLPILHGIVEAPVFGPDGAVVTTPGYSLESQLWFHSRHLEVPSVPACPSQDDLTEARRLLLDELLVDFPFVDDASKAHTVAAIMLPFVRQMIDGPTPLHVLDKPSPGTGASLLCDCIAIIATGRSADVMTEGRDDEEWRKRITAALLRAPQIILIDNVRRRLDSGSLSAAITATTWTDRILQVSKMAVLPVLNMWMATGNNIALSNEIARRTVEIRMDAKTDRPWQGREFHHDNLRGWVHEHRGELVWAALVMARAWIAAGRPTAGSSLGNFESWAYLMGGILHTANIPGFLANLTELYAHADEESQVLREFVSAWWAAHRDAAVKTADLYRMCLKQDLMGTLLGDQRDDGGRSQRIRLGRALGKMRDRVIGDHRVTSGGDGDSKGRNIFRLIPVASPPTEVPEPRHDFGTTSAPTSAAEKPHGDAISDALAEVGLSKTDLFRRGHSIDHLGASSDGEHVQFAQEVRKTSAHFGADGKAVAAVGAAAAEVGAEVVPKCVPKLETSATDPEENAFLDAERAALQDEGAEADA